MDSIILFLSLAGAILSIILFFKIWSMTSNVKALKKHLVDKDSVRLDLRIALAKKSPDIEAILFASMFKELYQLYCDNDLNTESNYMKIVEDYKGYYERAGVDFPKEFTTMDNYKFMKFL